MEETTKPKLKGTGGSNPGAPFFGFVAAKRKKTGAQTVGLVDFAPSPEVMGGPPGKARISAIVKQRYVRRWTIGLGWLALVSAILAFGPGLYGDYKARRASAIALQGEELIQKKDIGAAIETVRAAYMISPNAPEVLRAMAELLTAMNSSDAMTYWNWVVGMKGATDDDRRAAVECAMHNGLYSQASALIRELLARDGGNARNALLAARWSTQRGTPEETMHFATSAVNDDPNYKPAVLFLAVQELSNNYLHQTGVDALFRLADADDKFSVMAVHCIVVDPKLDPAEIDRLLAHFQSHPPVDEFERIAALDLAIRRHPAGRESLITQAVAAHQNSPPAELAEFAEWLNATGEAARVLQCIPRDRALSNRDIFTAYIDALSSLHRWADLKEMLSGATVPIEAPLVELYLSRCASEMGETQTSDFHWQNAVTAASYSPSQSLQLALYAEKLGQNERAADVYRTLTGNPITARIAYQGLWRVLGDTDTRARRDLLDAIVERWPRDVEMASEDIFLNLLLNARVPEMHQRAVKILAFDANSISHHTNVALACLRLNDPSGARHAYDRVQIDWNTAPVPDLVVYAATLSANGSTVAAHRLLSLVNRHALRPELRDIVKSVP